MITSAPAPTATIQWANPPATVSIRISTPLRQPVVSETMPVIIQKMGSARKIAGFRK
jgi:hypothetical protein